MTEIVANIMQMLGKADESASGASAADSSVVPESPQVDEDVPF